MRCRRLFNVRWVRLVGVSTLALGFIIAADLDAQTPSAPAPASESAQKEAWSDPLGRSTPRGAVIGFLEAARAGDNERAVLYLNAPARGAEELAHQLFAVLDARLPARLTRITTTAKVPLPRRQIWRPSGPSRAAPAGRRSCSSASSARASRSRSGCSPNRRWRSCQLSTRSLPKADRVAVCREFLVTTRVGRLRLLDVLVILLALPTMYLLLRSLNAGLRLLQRRSSAERATRNVLPPAARLLVVIAVATWLVARLPLSLAVRQLWSTLATLLTTAAIARLLMLFNAEVERHVCRRIGVSQATAAGPLLRVLRRVADVLVIFLALMVTLKQFGIDPTPALAGLGVGGIAVALAAQKTLENVIAGASLVFDKAVRVGDSLKMGEVSGSVEHIGLRSTRIRTLDRTVVSVPNGQIANVTLETLSARDKYWFHPVVALRYETTPAQLRGVVAGISELLSKHPAIDLESVRVRFIRLGSFSMDIDVFAYFHARDWNHFLEIQEKVLFEVTEIIGRSGTWIAMPSQTTYLATAAGSVPVEGQLPAR